MNKYENKSSVFKALSDATRLQIIDMLSCGQLCACNILEKFNITQPTLSHHMKILSDSNLVIAVKKGKWTYYSLDDSNVNELKEFLNYITTDKADCICKDKEDEI